MPAIAETALSLRFGGDDLDPDELTGRLGKAPSLSHRKGEVLREAKTGRERIARSGLWIIRVEPRRPGDLDAQVQELLSGLTDDLAIWADLSARYRVDLIVGFFLEEENEGIELGPETITALAARGVRIAFDVYASRS